MSKIKIATHNKHFHPDDVFAVATLIIYLKQPVAIIRTRDMATIKSADYVVDVGTEYDESKNRFDHHQKDGAGIRINGIPYASFGLVWKKYGSSICGSEDIARIIEKKIVEPIDAEDNGVSIASSIFEDVHPYSYWNVIYSLNPTWKEKDKDSDGLFNEAVELSVKILLREIERARHFIEGVNFIEQAYGSTEDKRLIILDDEYSWRNVLNKRNEPLFVITPNHEESMWYISAVRSDNHSFKNRKNFPENWGSKRDNELALESGVSDAIFCHRNLFIAAAKSKDGAIKLAKLAIDNSPA